MIPGLDPDTVIDLQPFGDSKSGSSKKWNRNTSTVSHIFCKYAKKKVKRTTKVAQSRLRILDKCCKFQNYNFVLTRRQEYKNRSSRKTDSLLANWIS